MSDLGLTEQERSYVSHVANADFGTAARLRSYALLFAPPTAFAIYGIVKQEFVAEAVAFGALALALAWRLCHESQYVPVHTSVFRKVADHERASGGA